MATQLSSHFTLEEMIISQTAARLGLDNTPSQAVIANLTVAAAGMEKVRAFLGNLPIDVSSGYRSIAVNRAVGGVDTSAHCLGYAVDFICPAFGNPYAVALALSTSGIAYDQLIHEFNAWTHISFDPRMRGQNLTIYTGSGGYLQGIIQH